MNLRLKLLPFEFFNSLLKSDAVNILLFLLLRLVSAHHGVLFQNLFHFIGRDAAGDHDHAVGHPLVDQDVDDLPPIDGRDQHRPLFLHREAVERHGSMVVQFECAASGAIGHREGVNGKDVPLGQRRDLVDGNILAVEQLHRSGKRVRILLRGQGVETDALGMFFAAHAQAA